MLSSSQTAAYVAGWEACFLPRFTNPYPRRSYAAYAWNLGFREAMESEEGEQPQDACAHYEEA